MASTLPVEQSTRTRLLEVARSAVIDRGWSRVTMGSIAELGGVSRQTVYNDFGTKSGLAEALVLDELDRFLAHVNQAFARNPESIEAGVGAAVDAVLTIAEGNELLRAMVTATQGVNSDLLPLLTTEGEAVLHNAVEVVETNFARYPLDLTLRHQHVLAESLVRLVLSHIVQPSPGHGSADLQWAARRLVKG